MELVTKIPKSTPAWAVPTDSLTEIPEVREIVGGGGGKFDRVVRQLSNEISNLNPATQLFHNQKLDNSQIIWLYAVHNLNPLWIYTVQYL